MRYEHRQIGTSIVISERTLIPDTLSYAMHAPRFEPVKRNHDGLKHHGHRFAIKGGISFWQAKRAELIDNMMKSNALFARFCQ